MNETENNKGLPKAAKVAISVAVAVVVLAGVHQVLNSWADLHYATNAWRTAQRSVGFLRVLVPVMLLIAGFGGLAFGAFAYDRPAKTYWAATVVALVVGLAVLVPVARQANRAGYEALKKYDSVNRVVKAHQPYGERVSLAQAGALVERSMGDTPGEVSHLTFVPQGNKAEWCAVTDRKMDKGRIWSGSVVCVDGATGNARTGSFARNKVPSMNGTWRSKLTDAVTELRHGLVVDGDDVYGYLDGKDQPVLVVPVTRWSGADISGRELPAGVVVFQQDGSRKYIETVKPGTIPGPVMPISIAERVRESLNTNQGFVAYGNRSGRQGMLEVSGFSGGESDPAEINSANASEMVLRRADGRLVYVTPMVPYGKGQNVVGYLEVPADTVTAGKVPAATLYRNRTGAAEASVATVEQRIGTVYGAELGLSASSSGGSNGTQARVYEVTPREAGQMLATIGNGELTQWKVLADVKLGADNTPGDLCIYRVQRGQADRLVMCKDADSTPVMKGEIVGIAGATAPENTTAPTAATGGTDLSQVPTNELVAELGRRFPQG